MDESLKHYAKWKKPLTRDYRVYDSIQSIWNVQNRELIEAEGRLVVS